jgi:hypothetical protein
MKPHSPFFGLLQRRQCLVPTLRGWLLMLVAAAVLMTVAVRNAQSFLAVTDPVAGEVLVIEGWTSDYAYKQVIAEFGRHHYRKLYVTGGPVELGASLSEYKTFAELGAATLIRMGLNKEAVQAVPSSPVRRDRTYASALALKHWLAQHNALPASLNLMSIGTHSRRSRLLFEKAFGGGVRVGIIAIENADFDANHWWRSSQGVRVVIGEMIAYAYARLLFFPGQEP